MFWQACWNLKAVSKTMLPGEDISNDAEKRIEFWNIDMTIKFISLKCLHNRQKKLSSFHRGRVNFMLTNDKSRKLVYLNVLTSHSRKFISPFTQAYLSDKKEAFSPLWIPASWSACSSSRRVLTISSVNQLGGVILGCGLYPIYEKNH